MPDFYAYFQINDEKGEEPESLTHCGAFLAIPI